MVRWLPTWREAQSTTERLVWPVSSYPVGESSEQVKRLMEGSGPMTTVSEISEELLSKAKENDW